MSRRARQRRDKRQPWDDQEPHQSLKEPSNGNR
jgi:hypothetical protein